MMDSLLNLIQNGLLYAENKMTACDFVSKVLLYTSRATIKTYIMKMTGPLIRMLSEKVGTELKERVLDNIKSLIILSKEDIKGISPQLQSVFVKTLIESSTVNSERLGLKAGENILRLLQFNPRSDVIVNDIMKSILSKYEKGEFINTVVETEILADIIRFYGHTLKPNVLADNFAKVEEILNSRSDLPYDYLVTLLSAFTKYYTDLILCQKVVEETFVKDELPRKLFRFLAIFNGHLQYFNSSKKMAIKAIKSLPKDQAVILLKTLGKIINKYRYFTEFDTVNNTILVTEYEKVIIVMLSESELFVPSNIILDGNLCVFLLSLGYLNEYAENLDLFKKILSFLILLIAQGKVNSGLLVNLLSLVTVKEISQNPDRDSIIFILENLEVDEKEIEIVDAFLKKIYYLNN